MKRILSLILAIMMIASLAVLSVSADDVKIETIDATGGEAGKNKTGDVADVTKKYFAVSYTMTAASLAGATSDNGCCGLFFGDNDNTCIFIPYNGGTTDTQRKLGIWDGNNLVFGNWWGQPCIFNGTASAEITPDTEVTVLVLGVKGDDGKTTVTAYLNGEQINVWGKELTAVGEFGGHIGWATKLAGHKATVKFAESDTELTKDVFDEKAPDQGIDTPENPGNPGTDTPVAPKTGEATAIVALVSVLALAGVVVASKKRA